MPDYGVTADGFTIKGFDAILADAKAQAQLAFGSDVDLSPTSVLRKILETAAAEDAELWKRMEDLYYANFLSTAVGQGLDRLGEDLGLERQSLFAGGTVVLTLANAAPNRSYILAANLILDGPGGLSFHTTDPVTLSDKVTSATVGVLAFARGPAGNLPAKQGFTLNSDFQQNYTNLGPTVVIKGQNPEPLAGGDAFEDDDSYRGRLLGLPRNLWTKDSVTAAAQGVNGVIDVLCFDRLGGVDVLQSFFNQFPFSQRLFSGARSVGEPYFFDVIVAHEFARPWRTTGSVTGIFESVTDAITPVRPVGIYPNVIEANHIEVGIRAKVLAAAGQDLSALHGRLLAQLTTNLSGLKLGGDVLYSQVMRALADQVGVVDVQDLRLRRCPAAFGRITFGSELFEADNVEAAAGENLVMAETEIALFRSDSGLTDLEVVVR